MMPGDIRWMPREREREMNPSSNLWKPVWMKIYDGWCYATESWRKRWNKYSQI